MSAKKKFHAWTPHFIFFRSVFGAFQSGENVIFSPFSLILFSFVLFHVETSRPLENVFSQEGPFDGILGFSQGAAMAAIISTQQEKLKGKMDFRFVVLSSGFAPHLKEMECGPIKCPSLHIFGNEHGNDRQIDNQASKELASLYDDGCSVVVEHDCGHIIPTRSPYIDEIKAFLGRFL